MMSTRITSVIYVVILYLTNGGKCQNETDIMESPDETVEVDIYGNCGDLGGKTFCLGTFRNQMSETRDSGCFNGKICEALVKGDKNGDEIIWTLAALYNRSIGTELKFAITDKTIKFKRGRDVSDKSINYDFRDALPETTLFMQCHSDQTNVGIEKSTTGVFYMSPSTGQPGRETARIQDGRLVVYNLTSTFFATRVKDSALVYTVCIFRSGLHIKYQDKTGAFEYDLLDQRLVPTMAHIILNHNKAGNYYPTPNSERAWGSRIENLSPYRLFHEYSDGTTNSGKKNLTWLWVLLAILLLIIIAVIIYLCLRKRKTKSDPKQKKVKPEGKPQASADVSQEPTDSNLRSKPYSAADSPSKAPAASDASIRSKMSKNSSSTKY